MEGEELIKRKDTYVIASNRALAAMQRLDDLMLALDNVEDDGMRLQMKEGIWKASALIEEVDDMLTTALAGMYERLEEEEI